MSCFRDIRADCIIAVPARPHIPLEIGAKIGLSEGGDPVVTPSMIADMAAVFRFSQDNFKWFIRDRIVPGKHSFYCFPTMTNARASKICRDIGIPAMSPRKMGADTKATLGACAASFQQIDIFVGRPQCCS